MRLSLLAALVVTTGIAPVAATAAPPSVAGTWRNPQDSVHVDMRPCGQTLCGTVGWANDRAVADAQAGGADRLVGVELFRNLVPDGPGHWSGEVFIPDLGRTVAGTITQVDRTTLEVEGCVIPGLVCQSQDWTRVADTRR